MKKILPIIFDILVIIVLAIFAYQIYSPRENSDKVSNVLQKRIASLEWIKQAADCKANHGTPTLGRHGGRYCTTSDDMYTLDENGNWNTKNYLTVK